MTGDISALPLVMFLIIFMWTPPFLGVSFIAPRITRRRAYRCWSPDGAKRNRSDLYPFSGTDHLLPVAFETVGMMTYGLPAAAFGVVFPPSAWRVFRDASEKIVGGCSAFYLLSVCSFYAVDH